MKLPCLCLLAAALVPRMAAAQAASGAPVLPARIADAATRLTEAGTYPAMVVVMVDGDHTQIAGFGKLADGRAPNAATVFEIGSITKTFTAAVLAHDVQTTPLTLDTPVAGLLPDFQLPSRDGHVITLGLLAEQFSGLPRLPGNLQPTDLDDPYADYDSARLKRFLASYTLARDPGASYEYSNLGFGLLGEALAEHANLSYGALLHRDVLALLGMASTDVKLTTALRARLAPGHDEAGQPAVHWSWQALAGAGALLSDGSDMLRYLQANMGRVKTPLGAALRLAHEPRRAIGGDDRIGLAWMTRHTEAGDVIWHNGETGGYASFIGFTADGRRGVVILANGVGAPQDLGFAALVPSLPVPVAHKAVTLPPAQLDDYVGRYPLAPGFVLRVFRREAQLFAQATGQGAFPTFASARDVFFAKVAPIGIDFRRGNDCKVDGLVLHQNGSDRAVPLAPAVLKDYVGRYTLSPGVQFAVSVDGGQLRVQLTGQAALPVYARAQDHFFYTDVDAQIDFQRDATGKVVALVLHQNGRDLRAPRQPSQ
ncbi:serine hydrolase [Dyella sp.]|jgi:CubicO group peptidase (beta-lactamase class C family)|uniref:serine hydrolase n=1 Tax=Dyella sp. TaxID=1869338 RepID=UPI002D76F828|nr:serine hydrolase [Dyella sp.]HET6432520.1 serine hydrolase [Dyella sp.]